MTVPLDGLVPSRQLSMVPQARSYWSALDRIRRLPCPPGEDEGFHRVADGHNLIGVDVVLDGTAHVKDDAFGLIADVEQNLVPTST